MHHEYFFEVVNVLSCSPFMFENTENKQLDWIIRHSHLAPTLAEQNESLHMKMTN